jgi:hypothetical protein
MLGLRHVPLYWFRIGFLFSRKHHWGFNKNCIKSVDSFVVLTS